MLGCHDFCGHYDWTFHYLRRRFGQEAVSELWREAIGFDAQQHYVESGRSRGLAGLYDVWNKTGEDEHCDWTWTLDVERNVLRNDMRRCPSKGFLLAEDRHADEDYCDHCMGWISPVLESLGMQVASHEHNHAGQCWTEIREKSREYVTLTIDQDIRKDPRWQRGFIDAWREGQRTPLAPKISGSWDSAEVLRDYFAPVDRLVVLGRGPSAIEPLSQRWKEEAAPNSVLVTDPTYATGDVFGIDPAGVMVGDQSSVLSDAGIRWQKTPVDRRPLLLHAYLPAPVGEPGYMTLFEPAGLPRPLPVLPLLIRKGLYRHEPGAPYPTTGVFLFLLAIALEKEVCLAGIDLYQHPSGKSYVTDQTTSATAFPVRHSVECEITHLRRGLAMARRPVNLTPNLAAILKV
jgi:hypothetical protein